MSESKTTENISGVERHISIDKSTLKYNNEEYNERIEIMNSSQPMIGLQHLSRAKIRWKRASRKLRMIKSFELENTLPTNKFKVKRHNKLKRIFLNRCGDKIKTKSVLLSFSGLLLGIFSTLIINLLPQHDVIKHQKYWYESDIGLIFGWGPVAAANIVNICLFCVGSPGKSSLKPCAIAYTMGVLSMAFCFCAFYVLWTYVGDFVWPMPFQGYIVGVCGWYVMTLALWFQYPTLWRSDPPIRKKMLFTILFLNVMVFAELTYKGILAVFQIIPSDIQWSLVFVLLLVREWHSWILSFLGKKVSGNEDLSVEVIAIHYAAVRHIIFLSVNLGGITTTATNYFMFGCDFFINMLCTFVTIWLKSKPASESNDKKQIQAIMTQLINESVEFIMPITYCACYLIAYFGPNAELMGNVKNDSWQYISVDNIEELNDVLFWNFMMFIVDLGSTILTIFLLFRYSKINILRMYIQMQDQMWYMLAIQQGYIVSEVSCIFMDTIKNLFKKYFTKDYYVYKNQQIFLDIFQYFVQLPISFASDFMFQFDWIHKYKNNVTRFSE